LGPKKEPINKKNAIKKRRSLNLKPKHCDKKREKKRLLDFINTKK